MKYQHEQNSLDVTKTKEMSGIETDKFKNMVSSIGSDTIQAIATAGPEMQVCTLPFLFTLFTLIATQKKIFRKTYEKYCLVPRPQSFATVNYFGSRGPGRKAVRFGYVNEFN